MDTEIECIVYERELISNFTKGETAMFTEIFVPEKNITITIENGHFMMPINIYKSNEPNIKDNMIFSLTTSRKGAVENIRKVNIPNDFIDNCVRFVDYNCKLRMQLMHMNLK